MLTIILQSAPYGDEKIWNALRLAKALTAATVGMKVNIFLLGDAVTTAKKGQKPPEGYYNLEFDFNQDPELVMDILKHGSGVEVIGPASLKNKVKAELEKAFKAYA